MGAPALPEITLSHLPLQNLMNCLMNSTKLSNSDIETIKEFSLKSSYVYRFVSYLIEYKQFN
jgi:hypothetical protein